VRRRQAELEPRDAHEHAAEHRQAPDPRQQREQEERARDDAEPQHAEVETGPLCGGVPGELVVGVALLPVERRREQHEREHDDEREARAAQVHGALEDGAEGRELRLADQPAREELRQRLAERPARRRLAMISSGSESRKRAWMPKCRSSGSGTSPGSSRRCHSAYTTKGSQVIATASAMRRPVPEPPPRGISPSARCARESASAATSE
jgi:hypothetical protein